MPSEARVKRIARRINQELASILLREAHDPRLAQITVTGVDVDRELAYATIYVAALEAQERSQEVLQTLRGARGYLRRELASRIPLRSFPQLRFRWDWSPDRGAHIDELLEQLRREREEGERDESEGGDSPGQIAP